MKNNDLLNELKERGIIEYTAESEKGNLDNFFDIKNRNKKAAYIGADPSAKSLHLGNYATYIVLK
jgi:tyrosyl-tRNA synthetase